MYTCTRGIPIYVIASTFHISKGCLTKSNAGGMLRRKKKKKKKKSGAPWLSFLTVSKVSEYKRFRIVCVLMFPVAA